VKHLIDKSIQREDKNRKLRKYHAERNANKERDKFIKQYEEGWLTLAELKKSRELSFSDAGKFAFLCTFIQKDTGLIVNSELGCPMNSKQMADAIVDDRSNFNRSLNKFIELGMVSRHRNNE
jgi:hypothetical protein